MKPPRSQQINVHTHTHTHIRTITHINTHDIQLENAAIIVYFVSFGCVAAVTLGVWHLNWKLRNQNEQPEIISVPYKLLTTFIDHIRIVGTRNTLFITKYFPSIYISSEIFNSLVLNTKQGVISLKLGKRLWSYDLSIVVAYISSSLQKVCNKKWYSQIFEKLTIRKS